LELTGIEIALALAAMTVAATIQCSIGFGATLVALPVLAMISPVFAPGPLVLLGIVMGTGILLRDRSELHVEGVQFAWPGQLAGIGIGILFLQRFPVEQMNLLPGVVLLAAVALSGSRWHVGISPRSLLATGVLSGFMGTLSALAGAPLGLLYQKESGPRLRSTLACLLLIGSASTAAALWWSGRIGPPEWKAALLLLPGALAGYAISYRVAPVLDTGYTRRAVLAFASLGGIVLVARTLW
jgi:uncharacterized membrane protein YfcA